MRSVKDGCSPQGQCGCCTVLVDGQPRVACVTPARRVQGRTISTLEGLDADVRDGWAQAFAATGGSQCGFCTPGIICRFAGLHAKGADHSDRRVAARALAAHLCRCTGWQPILDAWQAYPGLAAGIADAATAPDPDQRAAAELRATIEGRTPQSTGPQVSLGAGGFADDTAPVDALVAVRAGPGCEAADEHGWVVAGTAAEARRLAGQIPGRRTTASWEPPLEVPPGDWAVTLRTSWDRTRLPGDRRRLVPAGRRAGLAARQRRRVRREAPLPGGGGRPPPGRPARPAGAGAVVPPRHGRARPQAAPDRRGSAI